MLSKSSKYALRAVLFLSLNSSEERKYSPQQIAQEIDIPAPFLAKTLQQLSKYGIVSSTKGRHGGFYLTENDKVNSILSVVECIDGTLKIRACFLGLPACDSENPCAIHQLAAPMRDSLLDQLAHWSIGGFAVDVMQVNHYLI
ncbi:MAG: Rrf2 family transcriptional regulator [Flavobacteriaceae bacterium]|nr:Rrf2 family transcriptional regulator [Flavobacteriaceae bacterium]